MKKLTALLATLNLLAIITISFPPQVEAWYDYSSLISRYRELIAQRRTITRPTPPSYVRPTIQPTPTATPKPTVVPTVSPIPTSTPRPTTQPKPTPTTVPTPIPTPPPTVTPTPTPTPLPSDSETIKSHIMKAINDYRLSQGLSEVSTDHYTCGFAKVRAEEISKSFNHDGFSERVDNNSLPYPSYATITENIAMTPDYTRVVPMWIASSGHARNMREDTPFVCVESYGNYYAYEGWKPLK